jgi:hypothetical protein
MIKTCFVVGVESIPENLTFSGTGENLFFARVVDNVKHGKTHLIVCYPVFFGCFFACVVRHFVAVGCFAPCLLYRLHVCAVIDSVLLHVVPLLLLLVYSSASSITQKKPRFWRGCKLFSRGLPYDANNARK